MAHYPDYTKYSEGMSSKIQLSEYKMDCLFSQNECLWILEFNKIIFSKILYPNLCHWIYRMDEIESYELRNYLILPLNDNEIDWKLMEEIVKFFYSKHRDSYHLKQLLLDLGLLNLTKNENKETKMNEKQYQNVHDLGQMVFIENGRWFVPLNESKQRILPIINRIIKEFKEEKLVLNEMDDLLIDDDDDNAQNDECKEYMNVNDEIVDKIEDYLYSANKKLQIISFRFDVIRNFGENMTESVSFIYGNNKKQKKWIHEPMIDAININQNGLFKAPFDAHFFYGILRMPFILNQIERILSILQFIQSQQYLSKPMTLRIQSKTNKHSDSFLMKLPLLTLSKIVYQQRISIPHHALFKNVGQQLLTLIYSTSSALSLLSTDNMHTIKLQMNMVDITQKCMTNSVKRFRKTLESNQIMHYFAPSQFRNSYWRPPRFHNVSSLDTKSLIDGRYEYIAESQMGQNVNEYISKLLHPTSSDTDSDKLIFSMMTDLFASVWYYNYGKINSLNIKQLFLDCNEIINWMQIDKDLNVSPNNLQKITNDLDECAKSYNISNDYAFFNFYHQLSNKQNTKRSLLKSMNIPKIQTCEEKELEPNDNQSIEVNKSMSIKWSNEELKSLNPSLQAMIYKFVSNIEYEFEYPFICMTVIDPFFVQRKKKRDDHNLSFELLYDLGNIVLNTIITITVSTNCYQQTTNKQKINGMDRLLFYKKCLMSNQYLCHQCRVHRLHRHILTDKENENLSSEIIAAFMLSIIGAIYIDSNLMMLEQINIDKLVSNERGLQMQSVWDFVERFLPETVLQEDIEHILHLLSIKKGNVHKQSKRHIFPKKESEHIQQNEVLLHRQYPQNQRQTNHQHQHKNGFRLSTVSEMSEHSEQLKTPKIVIRNGMYRKKRNRVNSVTDINIKRETNENKTTF